MARTLNEHVIDEFRNAMGSAFAVKHTKAVPTVREIAKSEGKVSDTVHLCDHNVVRVVTCLADDSGVNRDKDQMPCPVVSGTPKNIDPVDGIRRKKKQARLLPCPGIDIEFLESETGLTDAHFNARFKKLLGNSGTVKKLLSGGRMGDNDESDLAIEVGDPFVKDGAPHAAVELDGDGVSAMCKR